MQSSSTKISAGLVLTNGKVLLGCIPFGRKDQLDIPKGIIESNESPEQAVIRETKEEIGIDIIDDKLDYKGKFFQYKGKYLHIFVLFKENLPELSVLRCSSTFFHPKFKKEVVEHTGFKYIYISDISKYFYKSLIPILEEVCGLLKLKELGIKKIKKNSEENLEQNSEELIKKNNSKLNDKDDDLDSLIKKLKQNQEEEKSVKA